jgi:hypothetical protein
MTEKEIERYFCKRVRAAGGFAYKFRSITQIGVADRIACMPNGECWFIELKKAGGRLSALQRIFSDEMTHTKQHYACLWSKDEVDEWLKRFS